MVIDNETLQPLHSLTKEGEKAYKEFLLQEADEMIFKKEHPFLWFFNKLRQLSKIDMELIERRYNTVMKEIEENRK